MPVFPAAYTRAWDETTPLNTIIAGYIGQWLRYAKIDLRERMQCLENGMAENVTIANVAANYAIDISYGNIFVLTMTADTTFTFTNPPPAAKFGSFMVILVQDGTGGWTSTWPATINWQYNVAPALPETASTYCKLVFGTWDSGTAYSGDLIGVSYPV